MSNSSSPSQQLTSPQLVSSNRGILPANIAKSISSIASISRLSLRTTNYLAQTALRFFRNSAGFVLESGREAILGTVDLVGKSQFSSRQSSFSLDAAESSSSLGTRGSLLDLDISDESFPPISDSLYLSLTKFLIMQGFSLAELCTISGLDFLLRLTDSSFSVFEESIRLFDGIFGYTETSHGLASFLALMRHELFTSDLMGENEASSLPSISKLGVHNLIKSVMAYAVLQQRAHRRIMAQRMRIEPLLSVVVPPGTVMEKYESSDVKERVDLLFQGDVTKKIQETESLSSADQEFVNSTHIIWESNSPTQSYSASCQSLPALLEYTLFKPFHESQYHALNNMAYFSKFASASYGRRFMRILGIGNYSAPPENPVDKNGMRHCGKHVIFAQHAGLSLDCIIGSSAMDNPQKHPLNIATPTMHVPDYFIAVDKPRKLIIATLRGTLGLSDVLTSLSCSYTDLTINENKYRVHSGMLTQARLLAKSGSKFHSSIKNALSDKYCNDFGLVLVGHSLGAGVASLIGLLWSNLSRNLSSNVPNGQVSFWTSTESDLPSFRPIHVYVYGPACTACPDLSRALRGLVTTVVHEDDWICHLSLGIVQDLKKILWKLSETHQNSRRCDEILSKCLPKVTSPMTKQIHVIIEQNQELDEADIVLQPQTYNPSSSQSFLSIVDANNLAAEVSNHSSKKHSAEYLTEMDPDTLWFWAMHQDLISCANSVKLFPPGDVYWVHSETLSVNKSAFENLSLKCLISEDFFSRKDCQTIAVDVPTSLMSQPPQLSEDTWTETKKIGLRYIDHIEDMFSELQFSTSMAINHSPARYEWSLHALRANMAHWNREGSIISLTQADLD